MNLKAQTTKNEPRVLYGQSKIKFKNDDNLKAILSTVKISSDYREMQYTLENSGTVTFKKDSLVKSKNFSLNINTENTELGRNKIYEYKGINKANGINHTMNKEKKKRK